MRMRSILGCVVVLSVVTACGGSTPPPEPTAPNAAAATPPPPPPELPAPPKAAEPQKTLGQKMEETSKALVDAWNSHDADKVAATYAENATFRLIGAGMPDFVGRAAIKNATADTLKAFPDFKVAVTRTAVKGNQAFTEWVITGTNNGDSELFKLKATKRPIGVHGVDVATYDDAGMIKEDHRYYDVPTMMMQLDAKAKAGTFRAVEASPSAAPSVLVSKGTPDEQKNADFVAGIYKASETKKGDAIVSSAAADAVLDDYTTPAPMKGQKAIKGFMDMVFKAIPDMKTEVATHIAAGDLVFTEGTFSGTMKGNMGPVKATNKPVTMHFVHVNQVKDGKLVGGTGYGNTMEMMPPPAAKPAAADAKGAKPAADAKPAAKAATPATPAAPKK